MTHKLSNREFLKTATQSAHDRAEALWSRPNGFADQHAYHNWIQMMHHLHVTRGLPAALLQNDPKRILQEENRIAALRADFPSAKKPPVNTRHRSQSWAWGVQYVLNGSAIGASILLKSGGVSNWSTRYLSIMQDFAASGDLRIFFDELECVTLDRPSARSAAIETFRETAFYGSLENDPTARR